MPPQDEKNGLYRAGVGMTIFNAAGLVLVAERIDNPGAWQMPQGGIDDGENPEETVFREMEEEIGTRNARIIAMLEDWIHYDMPERTAQRLWGGKYKGQKQKWIALEFLGADDEIDLTTDKHPEFSQWKWVPLHDLLNYVVPFKRDVYSRIIQDFSGIPNSLKQKNNG